MELGARLKQARLEAGLSQRQLCGEKISRNMLSQIENGSARPSMDTLKYLAAQLGKPMGYFLEEEAVTSPNRDIMELARSARGIQVLEILKDYREEDPVYDRERWLLEALTCLELAKEALAQGKQLYCASLLERCAQAGARTPYYTKALESQRQLLSYQAGVLSAQDLWDRMDTQQEKILLLCEAAIALERWEQAQGLLMLCPEHTSQYHLYMGKCYIGRLDYQAAITHLTQAEETPEVYKDLELCYPKLEDYKQAYFYACKQKQGTP